MTLALDRHPDVVNSPGVGTQMFRTLSGCVIDRSHRLSFRFDGHDYSGVAGDTLASALLANGVRLVGRSFKYHRPRGILSAGSEEPNALVELRTGSRREPNTRATVAELYDGLGASSQNRWPSLRFDALSINAALAPIFAAGFYYKTFMWPKSFWEKLYEPMIRRAAGLGRAADAPDPDHYEAMHAHCDVLVIGAGSSGLAAALAAGRAGARVIIVDEDAHSGGRLNAERREIGGRSGVQWARDAIDELTAMSEVRVLTRTTLFGVYDHGPIWRRGTCQRPFGGPATARAPPAVLAHRRQAGRPRRGCHRTTACLRRQRPARRDAGWRRADLHQQIRGSPRSRHCGLHDGRRRLANGRRCDRRGRPGCSGHRSTFRGKPRAPSRRRQGRCTSHPGRPSDRDDGATGIDIDRSDRCVRAANTHTLRHSGDGERVESDRPSRLPPEPTARLERDDPGFRAGCATRRPRRCRCRGRAVSSRRGARCRRACRGGCRGRVRLSGVRVPASHD